MAQLSPVQVLGAGVVIEVGVVAETVVVVAIGASAVVAVGMSSAGVVSVEAAITFVTDAHILVGDAPNTSSMRF